MEDFLALVESESKRLVAKQIVSFSLLFFFFSCSQGWPVQRAAFLALSCTLLHCGHALIDALRKEMVRPIFFPLIVIS